MKTNTLKTTSPTSSPRLWFRIQTLRYCGLLLAALGQWHVSAAIDLPGPTTAWKEVRFSGTNQFDYSSDTQAGAGDLDLVGNITHPVLYTQYDGGGTTNTTADNVLGFRARIGNPASQTAFGGVLLIGVDGNADGKLDLFLSADGRNNEQAVRIWAAGTGANTSPSTTSIAAPTNQKSYPFGNSNYSVLSVSATSQPTPNLITDLNGDAKNDIFVSFLFPFQDVQSEMLLLGGVTITENTPLNYVLLTLTQNNSINGDIAGISGGTSSSITYTSLGLFSTTASLNNLPPTISMMIDRTMTNGLALPPIPFTVSDAETAASNLVLTATSSNAALLPTNNIVLGGSGTNREVTLSPASGQSGATTVGITVSDGTLTATVNFQLTVVIGNGAPTDLTLSSASVAQSAGTNALLGTLTAVDADSGDTHSYALVAGAGSADNAAFSIQASGLRANNASAMSAGSYSVRIRATDSAMNSVEKFFSISVVDDVAPQIVSVIRKTPEQQTVATNTVVFTVTFSENVINVGGNFFGVTPVNGSTVAGTVIAVGGGPLVYDVTFTITAGTGEFRLDVPGSQIPN